MIAGQLLHAIVVAALLALGAACLAPLLRAARRPTRFLWAGTLALAAAWPALQRLAASLLPAAAEPAPTIGVRLLEPMVVGAAAQATGGTRDDVVLALWALASALLALRLGVGMLRLGRERATWRADHIDGVAVRVAPHVGPAVVGVGRMEIVVPQWIVALDPALRVLALRHEEEHRAARDPLLLLAAAVILALVPWNLPLWWIARRLRLAIEVDCDARVLGRHPDAARYGRLLLLFAQRPGAARPLAPALSESVTDLQRRIEAMSTRFTVTTKQGALLGAATAVLLGAACSLRAPTNATNAAAGAPQPAPAASPKVMDANQTFFEFQVEKQVTPLPGNEAPVYPADLRAAKVEGQVLAQFVVDTLGAPQMTSFKVLKSDHQGFTDAVAAALPAMRFHPAEIRGRKVRQLVQMPFVFGLSREAKVGAPVVPEPAPTARRSEAPKAGYFEFTIDKPATIRQAVAPRYPDALRAAKVEGEVVASFVVDTTGLAEMSSFKVKRATDPAFVDAVKAALAQTTFDPATVKGRKVRQLLEMPFAFSLSR